MRLTWYGHAAFLLESGAAPESTRVVLDPYRAPDVGTYAPINDWADMVVTSHENEKYHSFVDGIQGRVDVHSPYLINGLDLLSQEQPKVIHSISFTATQVFENEAREGRIAMVGVAVDGIRTLHMGDCGHGLSAEETAACGQVDVLLALAGGPPTLLLPELVAFIGALKPKIVVPMHFGNDKINLSLQPLSEFLALLPQELPVRYFDAPTVSLSPTDLPMSTEVWVLPPAR